MQIEVGGVYKSRIGERVKIIGITEEPVYPFLGDDECTYRPDGMWLSGESSHDLIAEWTYPQPVTLSPTWEVMDPADAAHDLERIPLPDGKVYARRVVVPVMGEVTITGFNSENRWAFGNLAMLSDTHRITLPTRDGELISGTYTSADGHSVVVGVV